MILKHRRGTTQEWLDVDLIPEEGELVLEELSDGSWKCKIGNGSAKFSELPYLDEKTKEAIFNEIANIKTAFENKLINLEAIISKSTVDTKQELTDDINNKYTELSNNILAVNNKLTTNINTVNETLTSKITALETEDSKLVNLINDNTANEKKLREEADELINNRIDKIDAFFAGAAEDKTVAGEIQNALDTLVEIQNYITSDGNVAKNMLDAIDTNTTNIDVIESDYIRLGTNNNLYIGKAGIDEIIFDCGSAKYSGGN